MTFVSLVLLRWLAGCGIVSPVCIAVRDSTHRFLQRVGMVASEPVNYDQAAGQYAAHRQVHTGVFRELYRHGRPAPNSAVLEVGCGTGNYISAMTGHSGCLAWGLDPSAGMLSHARARSESVHWILGQAEQLAFAQTTFDLIFSVDVIHHVADKAAFFGGAARTLRPGGWVCTVTDSEQIIQNREILSGYFPETVEIELARYPRIAHLETWMIKAGLTEFKTITVKAPYEITDISPFRDKAFSSLHLISHSAWQAGLARLESDLARGPVTGMSRYACVWGHKP